MNKELFSLAVAGALLSGCSTTPENLADKTEPIVRSYSANYQEIYRRVSSTAKRCISGNAGPYTSLAVDADLYSELGYGDVQVSMINYGVRNYYWTAKIELAGANASRLTLRSGNSLGADRAAQAVLTWADGGTDCPAI